jgi:metal-sulfur cluster biosynthetic enzyme
MENKIIDVLKECYDPEIPIDLWSLGLIYEINAKDLKDGTYEVGIIMTLTTPGCVMGSQMANDIKQKLENLKDITKANVDITFDPPWEPSMMNDTARKSLGFDKKAEKKNDSVETDWE